MPDVLLQINNLKTVFPTQRGQVMAVNDLSLSLQAGEILGIVGESGCGKSTALLSILGLVAPPGHIAGGEIQLDGRDLRSLPPAAMREMRGREIAMVFQDPQSTLNPSFTVGEQIRESLRLHNQVPGASWPFDWARRSAEQRRVLEVMEEVGIPSPVDRYGAFPHEFSGGMQQRALIAIALACRPRLLLADEPTTALDVTIQAQILDLMRQLNSTHKMAVILVTHDLGVAAEFCHTIAVMYAGQMVEYGTVDQVIENPLHPYTQGLLACRPDLDRQEPLAPIGGDVPDLTNLPSGCIFQPRCPYARPACEGAPIALLERTPGHLVRCIRPDNYRRVAEPPNYSNAN